MKPILAGKEDCTGCGACIARCPRKCISFINDDMDNVYPFVDSNTCVECGMCVIACPSLNGIEKNKVVKAYASWSTNNEERLRSASGGVASALYRFFVEKGYMCYGASVSSDFSINITSTNKSDELAQFQNSKYSYSSMESVYQDVEMRLKNDEGVFFVGLPCQVSALKTFLRKEYDALFTADLVCHGVCSNEYLKQHIEKIEKTQNAHADSLCFRDPQYKTEKYHFTLRNDKGEVIYNKSPLEDDVYQIGYHKAITYRDNCYSCKYASRDRCGDITLGDYWLLGVKIPFGYNKENVSLIFENTLKAEQWLRKASKEKYIELIERPTSEAFEAQGQLNRPSLKERARYKFERYYRETKDFEVAAQKAVAVDLFMQSHGLDSQYKKVKRLLHKVNLIEDR